jgi:hypothetical protein
MEGQGPGIKPCIVYSSSFSVKLWLCVTGSLGYGGGKICTYLPWVCDISGGIEVGVKIPLSYWVVSLL